MDFIKRYGSNILIVIVSVIYMTTTSFVHLSQGSFLPLLVFLLSILSVALLIVGYIIGYDIARQEFRDQHEDTDAAQTFASPKKRPIYAATKPTSMPVVKPVNEPSAFLLSVAPDAICRCGHTPLLHSDDSNHACNEDDCLCIAWDRRV